uniref:Distal membrane arm assembly complex 2-like protein n=1 Tax=Tetradesmus obliquus TaxID=3088 RepID=A0A383VY18_TETOB|eukprot:jgi/Sobl393_1/11804/SZX70365.1
MVVLAYGLPQLRHLELAGLDFEGIAAMAAVGQLTQLTQLCLTNTGGLSDESLMQLTGLVQLQVLDEPNHCDSVTAEGVDLLWAAVRRQRQLL